MNQQTSLHYVAAIINSRKSGDAHSVPEKVVELYDRLSPNFSGKGSVARLAKAIREELNKEYASVGQQMDEIYAKASLNVV